MAFWACQLLGAVCVALNAWMPVRGTQDGKFGALPYCIALAECKLLIVDAERADALEEWIGRGPKKTGVHSVLIIRSKDGKTKTRQWTGMKRWEDAMDAYTGPTDIWRKEPDPRPEDDCVIFFTSGTYVYDLALPANPS